LWVALVRLWPNWRKTLMVVKPETVIGWHRKGFRKWKSRRGRVGRGLEGRPPGATLQL
jgi:putative transposase